MNKRREVQEFQRSSGEFRTGLEGPVSRDIGERARSTYGKGGESGGAMTLAQQEAYRTPEVRASLGLVDCSQIFPEFTTAPFLFLPATFRTYLLIQNLDAAVDLFVGIGSSPAINLGVKIIAGGYYEPYRVPQNDIWLVGSGTGRACIVYGR